MMLLKQSTAVTIQMGPAVDATDGVTPETGLTPTVYLSKNGAVQAARSSGTAISHDRDGYYRVPLDTTDTATLGVLQVQFGDGASHLACKDKFLVVPAAVYDALVSGSQGVPAQVIDHSAAGLNAFFADPRAGVARYNTVAGGGANTITLDASASGTDNAYKNGLCLVYTAAGVFKTAGYVASYVGGTKVATIQASSWFGGVNPTAGDLYVLLPLGEGLDGSAIASAVTSKALISAYGGWTVEQALGILLSITVGKVSGGPGSPVFRNPADTANVVTATADANGNRTAVTVTP